MLLFSEKIKCFYWKVPCLSKTARIRSAIIQLANFQNGDLTTIVTEERLTVKSEKSLTNLTMQLLIV